MLKQALTTGIITLGFMMAMPATAHDTNPNYHNHDYQTIQPIHPAPPVLYCDSGHQIDKRQANQKRRIQHGKQQGLLVNWEVKKLKQQQRRIRKAEHAMRLSGRCLTRYEVQQLTQRLNKASNKIRNLKRNNVRRTHRNNHNHHNRSNHR